MKARLSFTLLIAFIAMSMQAQIPQGFNYQAVARDAAGLPVASASLQVRLTILSDTLTNVIVWEELHNPVQTNPNGVFSLVAGAGVRQIASQVTTFGDIDWGVPALYLRTSVYYLNQWRPMGTSRLWSVPYAMTAGDLSGSVKRLEVTGEASVNDDALFEVKNKNGQTVFAVYNEGVRVNVGSGDTKASKGGFAIGSFDENKAVRDYFVVNSDCVRVYIDNTPAKASKGGFAIGSFDESKLSVQEYLRVTRDSTRVYVNPEASKGASKGGFAVGGFSPAKGGDNNYLDMTPENYFIGQGAGKYNIDGLFNAYIGTQAGYMNVNGHYNIILGREAGWSNTASSNIFVGDLTGRANTTGAQNVMIGDWAGYNNTIGQQNVFLGAQSGWWNISGSYNNFMGFDAGYQNTTGSYNSYIGYQAGYNNKSGQRNTYIGYKTGYSGVNASASNNIFIGDSAGYSNTTGNDNIAIGNGAGSSILDGVYNIMIGSDAGTMNASGNYNTIMGYKAGEKNTSNFGTMVGYLAGNQTTTGFSQTMFGYKAGANNTGNYNTFIGVEAGAYSGSGGNNTYVGLAAGDYAPGSDNVFLGRFAGYNESGSNKLIIATGYTGTDNLNNALIYGDFAAKQLKFNGNVGVNANPGTINLYSLDTKVSNDDPAVLGQHNVTANYGIGVKGLGGWYGVVGEASNAGGIGLRAGVFGSASGGAANYGIYGYAPIGASSYAGYFNGNVYATGTIAWTSDKTLKKNILPLSGSLQKVLGLQGVTYEWKSESELASVRTAKSLEGKETDNRTFNFPTGLQIGVIAQDVEKILPELVQTDGEGLKSVDYTKIIPLLIEAIKDQQKQIDELNTLVNALAGQGKK